MTLRPRQYLVYFIVGGFVAVFGIGLREVISLLLPDDNPTWYAVSVGAAYGASILLSFSLHRRITFASALKRRGTAVPLGKFGIIAVIGLVSSSVLASAIRYGLGFDDLFGARGALLAFVVAGLLVSLLSYVLNAVFTFHPGGK